MKNNPTGFTNSVQHITAESLDGGNITTFSPESAEAHIEHMPAGGMTLQLPGPDAIPPTAPPHSGDVPNDGDTYIWRDPLGLVTNTNPLTVEGGGFNIGNGTNTPPTELVYFAGGTGASQGYTFNGALKLWVPWCPCAIPGGL